MFCCLYITVEIYPKKVIISLNSQLSTFSKKKTMIQDYQIQEFLRQAHRVGDAGLTLCSSGNISWRIGDEALVSGTGSWVPTLPKEKVAVCRVSDGEVLNGVKPSMESGFHLGVLRERPDCDVVLHFPVEVRNRCVVHDRDTGKTST